MKLSKKGMANIQPKVVALITAIILVVVLATMVPTLWTQLSTSLDSLAGSTIPFASLFNSTSGVAGLVFGAVVLLGIIGTLFAIKLNKR